MIKFNIDFHDRHFDMWSAIRKVVWTASMEVRMYGVIGLGPVFVT